MCKELAEAKLKVTQMERMVRTTERNLDVSRLDQRELSASLAGNVGRLDKLIGQAKNMRQQRADQQVDIIAGRRRQQYRLKVPRKIHAAWNTSFYLIPTFLVCVEALQKEALRCRVEKQESNRNKRAAQQQAQRLKMRLGKMQAVVQVNNGASTDEEYCSDGDTTHKYAWEVRGTQRNKGITMQFEQHVRCALATGATARQVQDMQLVDASYFLMPTEAAIFSSTLPQMRWFQAQREGLGLESYLYSFMRITGASRIIQWGFDETTLDGVSCLNQWAMLESPLDEGGGGVESMGGGVTIVTLECGGILPGGTAEEVVAHIEKAWERGQAAVEALRDELSIVDRDVLCPIVEGGVNLHKLYGVMHDTCNCANLVATLIMDLQQRKKREYFSDDVWELASPESRAIFNFLCGNHTRNLPIDR